MASASSGPLQPTLTLSPLPTEHYAFPIALAQLFNSIVSSGAMWQPTARISVVGSYVRSRAYGELNDFNQFFGIFPYPLIRSNQYGPLSSDAPNRVLFWGLIGLLHRLQFVPVLDAHSGFPYSKLDQNWNYIGQENGAG